MGKNQALRLAFIIAGCFTTGILSAQIDRDLDGVSDIWAIEFDALDLLPEEDTDQDGADTLEESRMGTDPRDPNSILRADIERVGDGARVRWNTVGGKSYRPRLSTDLGQPAWIAPDFHVGGSDGGTVSVIIDNDHITDVEGVFSREHFEWVPVRGESLEFDNPIATTWVDRAISTRSTFGGPHRIFGWVIPPEDGAYIFQHIFAEDIWSAFHLSTDRDPANAVVRSAGRVDEDDYPADSFPFANTPPITLQAGQPIFIELRSSSGAWAGRIATEIRWIRPGQASAETIPVSAIRNYLPEPVPVLPPGARTWCAEIEVFDVDSDTNGISDWEEIAADAHPLGFNFSRPLVSLGLIYDLFEVVALDFKRDGYAAFSEQEAEVQQLSVQATRARASATELRVPIRLAGSARPGNDYTGPTFQSIVIPANADSGRIDIPMLDDLVPESDEEIEIVPLYDPKVYIDEDLSNFRFVIRDDDRGSFGLEVLDATATESPLETATIRAYRTGDLSAAFEVLVSQTGSAIEGIDYQALPPIRFAPGQSEQLLTITPVTDAEDEPSETVELRLAPTAFYDFRPFHVEALVTIRDTAANAGELYLARYGPEGLADTDAWGYATLELSADRESAIINTRFANLTSPQTTAHIHQGPVGVSGPVVEGLATGEVVDHQWIFGAGKSQMLDALTNGLLYANVHTVNYPAGEIRGQFLPVNGSTGFTPPQPAALDAGAPGIGYHEASRFLGQATFGPRIAEIAELRQSGIRAWLDQQMALPATGHLDLQRAIEQNHWVNASPRISAQNFSAGSWWTSAIQAPDQLRQRVAFALSQIFVVSLKDPELSAAHRGRAAYHDLLARHAFGNFRELLYDVARSPVMGQYLSHLRNQKPDAANNIFPDENFAREVMQLFSIGLFELHPDGTLRLDPDTGLPLPTYGQKEISELARVFTGWGFSFYNFYGQENDGFFYSGVVVGTDEPSNREQPAWYSPMKLFPAYHDNEPKQIIGGLQLNGLDGEAELEHVVDSLFLHPNTGPFISRLLIQRLTTSNPSPAYVYRVSQTFADNGQGQRGDLAAVVRAILLDPEARDMALAAQPTSGKLKEPLVCKTQLLRAFPFKGNLVTIGDLSPYGNVQTFPPDAPLITATFAELESQSNRYSVQIPLGAPSVFNFFDPGFQPPGPLSRARLVSPEFSYLNTDHLVGTMNNLHRQSQWIDVLRVVPSDDVSNTRLFFDHPAFVDSPQIIADLSARLLHGKMSQRMQDILTARLPAIPADQRYLTALRLVLHAPEFFTQP